MWLRWAGAYVGVIALVGCGDTDCTDLDFDPASCASCGMEGPLAAVEGAAIPDWIFVGVGNPYWFFRTEVTLTDDGSVHVETLSAHDGNDESDGTVTRAFASAVLEAALPALRDAVDRPDIPREDDEPAYEFEVRPDDASIGNPFYAESEIEAAPPLCCVTEAFHLVSECVAGHRL